MIVPICLVFWSDQLRHSDPINIHVAQFVFFCTNIIFQILWTYLFHQCLFLESISACPPTTFYSIKMQFKLLQSSKTNRIVVDCFYFTQAITLCSLVLFQQTPSTLGVFTHSAPVSTTVSNSSQLMNVAVPILKLLSIITCYVSIIIHLLRLVYSFWLDEINYFGRT